MLKGIDASHWNTILAWLALKADGCSFMMNKISEGLTYTDDTITNHFGGAKAVGFQRGGYHFLHANVDGVQQADYFLQTFSKLGLEMPAILDLEELSFLGQTPATIKKVALEFLNTVKAATNKNPILYTDTNSADILQFDSEFASFPLWLANYNKTPTIPKPWSVYTFWQYTDAGEKAIANRQGVDTDLFNGSEDLLNLICNTTLS